MSRLWGLGRSGASLFAGLILALTPLARAAEAPERALAGRLEPGAAAAVSRMARDARAAELPADPLIATALEGASRGATPDRIVRAVRRLAAELGRARGALDGHASDAEIVAGASALRAGIPVAALARLRSTRPGQPLVVPLVVFADLVTRGVPPDRASAAVLEVTRAGARDTDLLRLRERVAQDIEAGASPADAAALRARGVTYELVDRPGAASALVRPAPAAARVP